MLKKITRFMVALTLGGGLAAGVVNGTACDDDDDIVVEPTGFAGTSGTSTGRGGTTGRAGSTGAGGAAGSSVGGASGNLRTVTVALSGTQEVPPVNPSSSGTATVTLNVNNGIVTVDGTFTGLSSQVMVAHIHGPAPVGVNAPILIPLTVTGTTSGTFAGTGPLDVTQVADLIAGQMYINVHSATYPAGELRGQIMP
jgi:hypothetical protein